MFAADIPYVPLQESSIVLAQAAMPSGSPSIVVDSGVQKTDFVLKECKEFPSEMEVNSAEHLFSTPADMLAQYFYQHNKRVIDVKAIRTSILENPKHGVISTVVDTEGNVWNSYDPAPGFLGEDKVVFQADFGGKHYRVVMKLMVVRGEADVCPEPRLIKDSASISQETTGVAVGMYQSSLPR